MPSRPSVGHAAADAVAVFPLVGIAHVKDFQIWLLVAAIGSDYPPISIEIVK
jgi:hypothetical protein